MRKNIVQKCSVNGYSKFGDEKELKDFNSIK
jgi:hypothetical protein